MSKICPCYCLLQPNLFTKLLELTNKVTEEMGEEKEEADNAHLIVIAERTIEGYSELSQ